MVCLITILTPTYSPTFVHHAKPNTGISANCKSSHAFGVFAKKVAQSVSMKGRYMCTAKLYFSGESPFLHADHFTTAMRHLSVLRCLFGLACPLSTVIGFMTSHVLPEF